MKLLPLSKKQSPLKGPRDQKELPAARPSNCQSAFSSALRRICVFFRLNRSVPSSPVALEAFCHSHPYPAESFLSSRLNAHRRKRGSPKPLDVAGAPTPGDRFHCSNV